MLIDILSLSYQARTFTMHKMEKLTQILLHCKKAKRQKGFIYLLGILRSSHRPPGLFMIFTFAS
jgi:hypothetical protein